MDLYGDNRAFGAERVVLGDKRWVDPASGEGEAFPLGTANLLQVVSVRKDGSQRMAYAFRLGTGEQIAPLPEGAKLASEAEAEPKPADASAVADEGGATCAAEDCSDVDMPEAEEAAACDVCADDESVADATDAVAGNSAACDAADVESADADGSGAAACEAAVPACCDEQAGAAPATSAVSPADLGSDDERGMAALSEAIDLINRMLDQAGELARHEFGYVGGVQVGIPAQGAGYTYVTIVLLDAHGQPAEAPLHLHVETGEEPGCPDSLSSKIEYDREGKPLRLALTEFGEQYSCRVIVNINEKSGKLSVQKVEEFKGPERRPHLLYKRGWSPKTEGERAARAERGDDERRGDRGPRGWDRDGRDGGRRGGWGRDERGGRGEGRWDDRGWDEDGRGRSSRGDWQRGGHDRRDADHDRGSRWGSRSDAARQGERDERRGDRADRRGSGDWDRGGNRDFGGRGGWDDRASRGDRGGFRSEGGPRGGWDDRGPRGPRDFGGERSGRDGRASRNDFRDGGRDSRGFRSEGGFRGGRDDRGPRGGASRDGFRGDRDFGGRSDRGSRDFGDRAPRGDRGFRGDRSDGFHGERDSRNSRGDRPSGGRPGDWRAERDCDRGRRDNDGRF